MCPSRRVRRIWSVVCQQLLWCYKQNEMRSLWLFLETSWCLFNKLPRNQIQLCDFRLNSSCVTGISSKCDAAFMTNFWNVISKNTFHRNQVARSCMKIVACTKMIFMFGIFIFFFCSSTGKNVRQKFTQKSIAERVENPFRHNLP